jgi:F-type H+-transporting ATPase subunit delta
MAQSNVIGWRYAKAYFDLAAKGRATAQWREQLARAIALVTEDDAKRALTNPRLSRTERTQGLVSLLKDVSPEARNLVRLMVEHGRLDLLPEVLAEYDRLADRASGVVRAEVVSAVPLDRGFEEKVTQELAGKLGGKVETVVKQDPEILGGLLIRIGDRVIDTSVRTRLQQLQAALA